PHTVTFDNGADPPLAISGRVRDPAAGSLEATAVFNPLGVSGPNAAFDPTVQISSGVALDPPEERVPFTPSFAQPGTYHYICAIHGPTMAGSVTVLPAGAVLAETPDQATARGAGD